jgi:glutathione S-transferase
MKLWYSPASPFVRKVMVVAHEAGLAGQIEAVPVSTTAVARNADLVKFNPAGKIPALVLDDGTVLFDSSVVCAYLDSINKGKKLAPVSGVERYRMLTLESLGDAVMDAAVLARYERALRPADKQWREWEHGQLAKVRSALDDFEANRLGLIGEGVSIGAIAVACALGYLDFRFADIAWRDSHPKLATWYGKFAERPSMKATEPKG